LRKGCTSPKNQSQWAPPGWGFLVAGSILAGIGIALTVSTFVFQIGRAIGIPGLIVLFIGIALLIVYFIAKKKEITPKG
jgi:hypothetical protein